MGLCWAICAQDKCHCHQWGFKKGVMDKGSGCKPHSKDPIYCSSKDYDLIIVFAYTIFHNLHDDDQQDKTKNRFDENNGFS